MQSECRGGCQLLVITTPWLCETALRPATKNGFCQLLTEAVHLVTVTGLWQRPLAVGVEQITSGHLLHHLQQMAFIRGVSDQHGALSRT